jgi:hypothetical protein
MSEPFEKPDPYAEMWDFFVSVPRKAFKFHKIAWGAGVGVDSEDPEENLVQDALEIGANDPALNPIDNQGIRFLWDDIRNGRTWKSTDEAENKPAFA